MKIDILTLFPEMIKPFISDSIIKRAVEKGKVEINVIDIRDYTNYNNNQVDDTPFGGGSGMVLMCEPVVNAIESVKTKDSFVIMTSPGGKKYNQAYAVSLKEKKHLIILCGHYEGFDERIKNFVDVEISVGDYVLTGGELPACVIMDSVVRLLPEVITRGSLESESFTDDLLDYPVYTRPRNFRGYKVPDVLLSGDHKKIEEYRNEERIKRTKENRSDLLN